MTREQISDVATAARGAAIGQAVQHGNRCVFAIVVVGLDVGAPMAVQTNAVDAQPDQVIRILQNGIHALQESKKGGGKTGGGLILLSVLALLLGALMMAAGCGSVEASDATDGTGRGGSVAAGGSAGTAGGAGGTVSAGVAGGGDAGAAGASGAEGGAAGGGQGGGAAGMTGGALDAGLTGAAGAGGSCAARGALCYQCPSPAPTCSVPNRGAWTCCDQAGVPACDPTWCRS